MWCFYEIIVIMVKWVINMKVGEKCDIINVYVIVSMVLIICKINIFLLFKVIKWIMCIYIYIYGGVYLYL